MFRFITLGIIGLAVYFGFSYLAFFSDSILILFRDYQVEFSVLTGIFAFIILQLVLIVTLKIICGIFNIPSSIKGYFNSKSLKKIEMKMTSAIEHYLLGLKNKSYDISQSIYNNLGIREKRFANIIIAENSKDDDEQLRIYQEFLNDKELKFFAHKKLAQIYAKKKDYNQAEKHAIEYFDFDEKDPENILNLMNIYSFAGEHQKLLLLVSKIDNIEDEFWRLHADNVSASLYKVAKDLVQMDQEEEAKKYLEYIFKIKPDHIETLGLYNEISATDATQVKAISKAAFNYAPSFDIARIYADNNVSKNPQDIYNELANVVRPDKHKGVFLALAAYLGLDDKIQQLK